MATQCPVTRGFDQHGRLLPVYCGLWTCSRCARQLARLWAWRVNLHVAEHGGKAWFWTLTMRGKYRSSATAFIAIPSLWDTFRKRIQRCLDDWSYVAFVEGQPKRDYMPHFHIISMSKCPLRLKDVAMESGFGYQATESKVDTTKAASYCAKYASKQHKSTPKRFRRVRCSQDWTKLPDWNKQPLIVKSRKETLSAFILRAHELTGVPMENLIETWSAVMMDDTIIIGSNIDITSDNA